MTTGQLLFYAGAALLGLAIILAVVFIVKKPKYVPESAAYDGLDTGVTQKLLNGYPTDRMTIRRDSPRESVRRPEKTELMTDTSTELMPNTEWLSGPPDSGPPTPKT